jgi:NitT/TauT family transport system permease protein
MGDFGHSLVRPLWFGLSGWATIFVVFMTALPLIVTNVWEGTKSVNPDFVEVGKALRFSRSAILVKVYFPAILPYHFSGSRFAFGFGWRVSLVAETIGSSSGIGYRIRQAADLSPARLGVRLDRDPRSDHEPA